MNKKMISNEHLFWFVGFFVGDGYSTYGRIGIDTTTSKFADAIVKQLTRLTAKPIKFEVYGDHQKFQEILTKNFLHYPKKKENWSDCVKIRIDSESFRKEFSKLIQKIQRRIEELPQKYQLKFLQGFFDAEGTVSPDGTVQIDLAKNSSNLRLIEKISILLSRLRIRSKLKKKKRRLSLIVEGRSTHIANLQLFRKLINFSSPVKRRELEIITKIYSLPKDERSNLQIEREILKILQSKNSVELKELMWMLHVKYDKLRVCLNRLIRKNLVCKTFFHKRVLIRLSPSSGPIGK